MTMTADQRADWLQERKQGIGGSDVAAILGLSPWQTAFQVWLDKTGDLPDEPTMAMRLGQVLEPFILANYAEQTGLIVGCEQRWCEHPEHPHHRATIDAAAFESDQARIDAERGGPLDAAVSLVEAKTTREYSWDEVPIYYWVQAQYQLHVTGLDVCTFAVLHDRRSVELYDCVRDDDDVAAIVKAVDEFWYGRVVAGVPPEVTDRDVDAVRWAFRQSTAKSSRPAEPELVDLLAQLDAAKATAKEAWAYVEALTARLIPMIGDTEQIVDPADPKRNLVTFKPVREFDVAAAVTAHSAEAAGARRLDVGEFKKAIGRKATESFMRPTDPPQRRLTFPPRKD